MKYKVGDVVKVRSDLEVGKFYGNQYLNNRMFELKTITIKEVRKGYYAVFDEAFGVFWYYTDEMLEDIEPKIEGYTLDELKDIIKEHEERNKPCRKVEPQKPKTVWDLKVGDVYWSISSFCVVGYDVWENDKLDNNMRDIGNCFLTKEEAEFEVEARKVYTQLKKYSREFVYEKENWYMLYNFFHRKIDIDSNKFSKSIDLYYESQDILEKAIKEVGEDRILKYYLKVK